MRLLVFLLGLLTCLGGLPAHADTPISLFQSFRGNVNFTGTAETLRSKDNRYPCRIVGGGVYAYLGGIPSGATVKSAQLYWAGSGTTADYKVALDGVAVPADRRYVTKAYANNTTYTYFSGAADVTTQVANKGNGYYYFSGLSVDNGNPWCAVQGVVGGFALAVVYSHPDEPFRMLNIYEGFKDFQYASMTIDLGDFKVPDPLPSNVTGRIGHITWEGDQTLSQGGEDLIFNDTQMVDKYPNSNYWFNPPGNQFNSASNVTGDATTFGIDFDIYTLRPPAIQPGQNRATTTYRSGQDMVILSSEIVAMPYVANADLSLAMTRSGDLTIGSVNTYTLTVSNGGLDTEMGPVTIVDTLPAGLKLVKAAGTGWTCANAQSNGQTVVTCSQAGPVASGAKMTPLTITVTPTANGSYTNTATVSGKTGDDKLANNTATNTSSVAGNTAAYYVFTKEVCKAGSPIVLGDGPGDCHRFFGDATAADANTAIYLTAVSSTGATAAPMSTSADVTQSLTFQFKCLPNGGVPISYAGLGNFDCAGKPQTVSVKFPAGQPTAVLASGAKLGPFLYADVGKVWLSIVSGSQVLASTDFISKPLDIRFEGVYRTDGSAMDAAYGFVAAGEPFTMRVGALMANGKFARSFGKEAESLGDDSLAVKPKLDLFLPDSVATPGSSYEDRDKQVVAAFEPKKPPEFAPSTVAPGFMDATVRWYEAGSFAATPFVDDYLGIRKIGGRPEGVAEHAKPAERTVAGTYLIGRFYPDHLATTVTTQKLFGCAPALHCPAASEDPASPSFPVEGAVYSGQPFVVTVAAYGLPRGEAAPQLALFRNVPDDDERAVKVSASKAPNDTEMVVLAPAAFTTRTQAGDDPAKVLKTATYSTGNPYNPASRAKADWGRPTLVYLRASMKESLAPGGSRTLEISSRTPAGAWTPLYEQGLMVIPGRLFVPNVFGADLLRMPVALSAQYWNGSAWVASGTDSVSEVASAIVPVPGGCRRDFAQDPKAGTCKAGPLTALGTLPVVLDKGAGRLILQAPPRGTVGSVDYTLDSVAAPWLPSTRARATFGLYKSPVIYLREVY